MVNKNDNRPIYDRVEEEMLQYDNAYNAAIDHLLMAEAHLFEEFEGKDVSKLLSEIKNLRVKIETEFLLKVIKN